MHNLFFLFEANSSWSMTLFPKKNILKYCSYWNTLWPYTLPGILSYFKNNLLQNVIWKENSKHCLKKTQNTVSRKIDPHMYLHLNRSPLFEIKIRDQAASNFEDFTCMNSVSWNEKEEGKKKKNGGRQLRGHSTLVSGKKKCIQWKEFSFFLFFSFFLWGAPCFLCTESKSGLCTLAIWPLTLAHLTSPHAAHHNHCIKFSISPLVEQAPTCKLVCVCVCVCVCFTYSFFWGGGV